MVGSAQVVTGDRVIWIQRQYSLERSHRGGVVLHGHRRAACSVIEENGGLLFLFSKVLGGHRVRLFQFIERLQSEQRRFSALGCQFLCRRVRLFDVEARVGKGPGVECLVPDSRLRLVTQRHQLVRVLDHLLRILELRVSTIVKRIDVNEEIRIWILRDKIIRTLDNGRRNFLGRARLLGVIFRLCVLRPLGRSRVLTRRRRLRECTQPASSNQEKGCHDREPRQCSCCVHSHFSSLKLQA